MFSDNMTNCMSNDSLKAGGCLVMRERPREKYIKPSCEVVEMAPVEMIAMSGEGSDTDDDFEFGGERTFESNRNRGEWGDLWSK